MSYSAPVDTVMPVVAFASEQRLGYVVRRDGSQGAEWYIETRINRLRVLIPCRRANRADDPYGVYLLADGSIWRSTFPQSLPIVAEIVP